MRVYRPGLGVHACNIVLLVPGLFWPRVMVWEAVKAKGNMDDSGTPTPRVCITLAAVSTRALLSVAQI